MTDGGPFDRTTNLVFYLYQQAFRFNDYANGAYRFFRDELGAKWMQFIPIVERASEDICYIDKVEPHGGGVRVAVDVDPYSFV